MQPESDGGQVLRTGLVTKETPMLLQLRASESRTRFQDLAGRSSKEAGDSRGRGVSGFYFLADPCRPNSPVFEEPEPTELHSHWTRPVESDPLTRVRCDHGD